MAITEIKLSMNLKKILILPVGFILTNFLYTACCQCGPVKGRYYQAVNLLIKPIGSNNTVVDNGTPVSVGALYLDCIFYTECIASHTSPFTFFVNTANACSCQSCGDDGLKNKVTAIEITSDNIYNNVPVNGLLNNIFKTYDKYNNGSGANISIDSAIVLINLNQRRLSDFNLYTTTKPGNTAGHQLNMKATFANGSTISSKTKAIYWQ